MIEVLRQAVLLSDPAVFWISCLAAALGAGLLLRKGLDGFWRLRLVADTPTAKIRSAPQGYVELTGRALPHRSQLAGVLTAQPCLWYRYKVEEHRGGGKGSRWVQVESGETDRPFVLDDGSGRCLVEPTGAEIHCRVRDTWYGSNRRAPKPRRQTWLRLGGHYRLTEERIREQDPIYLLGRFETPRRGGEEKERLVRALLSTWKRDPRRMADFDTDGDGEVGSSEWEQAVAQGRRIAERSESRLQAQPPLARVTATGDRRRPYLITTLTADSLFARLRLHAIAGTVLFVALASGLGLAVSVRLLHE